MVPITDVYESRAARNAAIILRQDPVVYSRDGDEPSSGLSPAEIDAYKRDGFIFMKNFFSGKETAALLKEVERLATDPEIGKREEAIREPGSDIVRSVFRVHELSPLLSRLSHDLRLVSIARQILGSEVYIHQSRANMKPGFAGKEFFWHSDFETWHVEDGMPAMRAVSCSILLTDNHEVNGPLMLIPGSHMHFISCVGETPDDHYRQSLRKQEYGVPDADSLRFLAEKGGGVRSMTGPAGSVVFFDCNTMHGSNSNISPYPRSNAFFVYNSVENALNNPKFNLKPRPAFIATRDDFTPIKPVEPDYLRDVSKQKGS
jgi:ectoine hydroxylase